MEVTIIDETMKNSWEKYVEENQTIAWQSYEWSYVVKKHYNVDFFPIAAIDNSKICGILPLYLVKTPFGKKTLISVPYAVAGGIVANNQTVEALLLEKAIGLYKLDNFKSITFKQYKKKMTGDLRTDDNFYNRELNLTEGINTLWDNIADINKSKIAMAKSYNLTLHHPSSDVNQFYNLLLRHHQHSGIPCVSKRWIKDLINFEMYSIALLKNNASIVAGTLVKEHKKTVSFPFTCIPDPTEHSNMYAYNLYWMLINKFAGEGKEIFHSGRIPKTDLTSKYRLGWGGTKYNYYYQYYPNITSSTEFSEKRGKKRDILSSAWKKLPIGVTRIIGPYIVKNFP